MNRTHFRLICSIIFLFVTNVPGGNIYRFPVNRFEIAFPWKINEINLYHYSNNSAWLQAGDSLNWMTFSCNSRNSWGSLRRNWDAYAEHRNDLLINGQKHISSTQAIYGEMQYNTDYLNRVHEAIEIEPYAADPFVACDSVEGDFLYFGPRVKAGFSHHIKKNIWWGIGLDYQIYQGLKKVYSRPENIRRKIKMDFSLALRLNSTLVLGFSIRPFDVLDIIKIVQQPDGTSPVIFRYRGEFLFTASTGTDERNARTRGMEFQPQLMVNFNRLKGLVLGGYYYQKHEVYDNPLLRKYDGFYQGRNYYLSTIWRYFFTTDLKSSITFKYDFKYLDDWAQEPIKKLIIYRSYQRFHNLMLGMSKQFGFRRPLILGFETTYKRSLPDKRDFLAKIFREAPITAYSFKIGSVYVPLPRWSIYSAFWINTYQEPAIWNYYGRFKGYGAFLGFSLNHNKIIWIFSAEFGANKGTVQNRYRKYLNIRLQMRKFL